MAHAIAAFVIIAWGVSFVSTKELLEAGLHPIEIYILRFAIAYILLLVYDHKKMLSNSKQDEWWFVACGLCGGSLYYVAENTALNYTLTSNVSLITSLTPLLTVLIIGLLYRSEKPTSGVYIGSVIAFLGVGFVIFNSSFVMKMNPLGDILSFAAALVFAFYSLILRRLNEQYTTTFITRKTFFYGVLTALPLMLIEPQITPLETLMKPAVWGNLLFLALVCSLIAFSGWSIAIKKMGAISANNYMYFQPVVTLIASALLLGDKITLIGIIGCALILGGVWLSEYLSRRKIR
ncbi:MAG: DMT family transporter [Muribaculaceae bacterium]|nr:DMT family transporter [Muribaculaceae bacterium]